LFRLLLCLPLIWFCACTQSNEHLDPTSKNNDSIAFYNREAREAQYSMQERLEFANRAFEGVREQPNHPLYTKILYNKNWLHYTLGQYDSLVHYDTIMQKNAAVNTAPKEMGMQHYLLGYYFELVKHQSDSAFKRYNRSKTYYQQANDSSGTGTALLNMGGIQYKKRDYFGSKETLTEALKYIKKETDSVTYWSAMDRIAQSHRHLHNYEEALAFYANITKEAPKANLSVYKNNYATVYIDLKKYQKAIEILEPLVRDTLADSETIQARVLDNLTYARWASGVFVKPQDFLKPLEVRKLQDDKRGIISSYLHLSEFYLKPQPELARAYLDSAKIQAKEINSSGGELEVLVFKMQLEPQNAALKERYIKLRDSLYESELKVKTQFAKYKYDDELKEQSILRLENEKNLRELELAQERFTKLWIIAALVVAILLILLIYYVQRYKARQLKIQHNIDRLSAIYDTEAAISRRLHDDFGSGLNTAMLLLQRQENIDAILDQLEKLYNQSRDFSRSLNDIDTGAGFKDALSLMLRSQVPQDTNLLLLGFHKIDWDLVRPVNKITLYKILRELMLNMRKHSAAKRVTLKFEMHSKHLKIMYSDNGKGASHEALQLKNGLRITEKRIEAIGGSISFETEEQSGFTSHIKIPF